MEPVIEVIRLNKTFGPIRAVSDLSFTVNRGEIYGFLGQNGAGKSTTLRMLLTHIRPDSGNIRVFGMDLARHRKAILSRMGAVIERPDVYPYLTGLENLRLFARMCGLKTPAAALMDQLTIVGLRDRAHSRVNTYSQGMRQRLGLAIALVNDPELLVLDEPSNGLDPQGIADIRNLILHLSRHLGKSVLVSSHLLSEIQVMVDRMLIIDRGKKITEGSVAELMDPSAMHLDLEVNGTLEVYAMLQQSEWSFSLRECRPDRILLQMPRHQIPAFNRYLVAQNVELLGLQSRYSLEDYFLSLTTENQHVDHFSA